mgnify:CR=1 FL=1
MILDNLPNKKLVSALKAIAAVDIEPCEDEYLRCFSYKANWAPGIDVASYENGGLLRSRGDYSSTACRYFSRALSQFWHGNLV